MTTTSDARKRLAETSGESGNDTNHTHEDFESFDAAEYDDTLIVSDGVGLIWTAFETEWGDWYAVRPRNEDDEPGPDGDRWRPVGLVDVEAMSFPLRCVRAHDAIHATRSAS